MMEFKCSWLKDNCNDCLVTVLDKVDECVDCDIKMKHDEMTANSHICTIENIKQKHTERKDNKHR